MDKDGYIGLMIQTWASCGKCGETTDLDAKNRKTATAEARALGWTSHRVYGWICPACKAGKGIKFDG